MAAPVTASALLDLDEDALVQVLLGLPAPRRREWIFVALVCRALHAAVRRAAVIDTGEEQRAKGLPNGRNNAPVTVVMPTCHRFATSIAGMMCTPMRIVYSKVHLRIVDAQVRGGLFDPSLAQHRRAREQFLRVLDHHLAKLPPQPLERARARRVRAETLAAYRLTTRALYHMIHLAPVHTLRSAFFEVIGGGMHCALDLSMRHHRCLVFFAAAHGRVDVLDWLVHRDPNRAMGYDYDAGLLSLLWNAEDVTLTPRHCMPDPLLPDRSSDIQLLIVRPAALHNRVAVLDWISATQRALRLRAASTRRGRIQRSPLLSTLDVGGLVLSIRASGVAADGTRVYGPDAIMADRLQSMLGQGAYNWRALRLLISEAANGASIDVLDFLWCQTIAGASLDYRSPQALQETTMRAAVAWALLLTLLLKPRRGAVVEWVVRRCYEDRGWLRAMAKRMCESSGTPLEHTWNPGIFDLEDLLYAALGTETRLVDYVMDAVDVRNEERLLRERIVGPGDDRKTNWLLGELAHTEALLAQWAHQAPGDEESYLFLPSDLDTYVPATGRGWLARSMAGYITASNELVGGGFFLRTDLDPTRWSRTDSLCKHLLRLSYHSTGVHTSSAPLLLEGLTSTSTTLSHRLGPPEVAELPESYVFESHTSSCNTWVPEHGLLGFTKLQQGVATVLKHWLLHVLQKTHERPDEVLRDRFEDWVRPLTEVPEACHAALADVCAQVLVPEAVAPNDAKAVAAQSTRRVVLSDLVTHAIVSLCSGCGELRWREAGHNRALPDARLRCRYTWAVAYAELAAQWGIVPDQSKNRWVLCTLMQQSATLCAAMRRALSQDTHATGNLRVHTTNH
jgi:hypothetical protein